MGIKTKKKVEEQAVESEESVVEDELEPVGSNDIPEEEMSSDDDDLEDTGIKDRSMKTLGNLDHSNLFANFDPNEEDDIEAEWEDSRVTKLDSPPMLGGGNSRSNLFGRSARNVGGRATSPKLYAQASNFPSCTQLRIWKWENGVPVGLGAIDSQASEEDLVREFFDAMPRKGEGRCQFKLRPIDINGNEMGTEINLIISEHHAAIQKLRRIKEAEKEEENYGRRRRWQDDDDDDEPMNLHMQSTFNPQFDRIMSTAEKRVDLLEKQLEAERNQIRMREEQRMQEQVDLATSAAQGVQVLTERMMADESKRAERAMAMQTEQSQTLITTLTSIFAQQQTLLQAQMEQQRRQDEYRLEQERQRAERERHEAQMRRERERLELEERRLREREEYDRKATEERAAFERKLAAEQKQLEIRLQREREEMQLRVMREKEEREARERWFSEERLRKEKQERDDQRQREQDRQRQHERMMRELEIQQQKDREHAERMMSLSKQELQTKAMGGLGEMIPMATGVLSKMGLEPMEVVQKLFAPEREESAWNDTLPKLLGAGADIARAALTGGQGVAPINPAQMLPQLPHNAPDEIDYEAQMQRMKQPQPIPREPTMEDLAIGGDSYEPEVISFRDTTLGQASQPSNPSPRPDQSTQIVGTLQPPSNMDIATQAGMTLGEQRDARNGLLAMVQQLHGADQANWEGIITQGLMSEPQIFTYIQAVTVRNAIREAGADEVLTENIVAALQNSPLVPSTINYGA